MGSLLKLRLIWIDSDVIRIESSHFCVVVVLIDSLGVVILLENQSFSSVEMRIFHFALKFLDSVN